MKAWYNIFNLTSFNNTGLTSRTLKFAFESFGQVTIEIFKGNTVAVQYDGEFMPINFAGHNPYESGDYAVYLDPATQDVWLGLPVDP